jgi:hypothetical protein
VGGEGVFLGEGGKDAEGGFFFFFFFFFF